MLLIIISLLSFQLHAADLWGIYRGDVDDVKKQSADAKAEPFPYKQFSKCIRRLLEIMAMPYGSEAGITLNTSMSMIGPNKNIVGLPLLENGGIILFIHPEKGLAHVPADFTKKEGDYLLTEWKSLPEKQRPVLVVKDEELLLGNQLELKVWGHPFKNKPTEIGLGTFQKTTSHREAIHAALTFLLDEYFARFQAKLNLSRMQSSYDYHGLMELAALLSCHQSFGAQPSLQQLLEVPMQKIDPQWRRIPAAKKQ